jgi:hypothetical protein
MTPRRELILTVLDVGDVASIESPSSSRRRCAKSSGVAHARRGEERRGEEVEDLDKRAILGEPHDNGKRIGHVGRKGEWRMCRQAEW